MVAFKVEIRDRFCVFFLSLLSSTSTLKVGYTFFMFYFFHGSVLDLLVLPWEDLKNIQIILHPTTFIVFFYFFLKVIAFLVFKLSFISSFKQHVN